MHCNYFLETIPSNEEAFEINDVFPEILKRKLKKIQTWLSFKKYIYIKPRKNLHKKLACWNVCMVSKSIEPVAVFAESNNPKQLLQADSFD